MAKKKARRSANRRMKHKKPAPKKQAAKAPVSKKAAKRSKPTKKATKPQASRRKPTKPSKSAASRRRSAKPVRARGTAKVRKYSRSKTSHRIYRLPFRLADIDAHLSKKLNNQALFYGTISGKDEDDNPVKVSTRVFKQGDTTAEQVLASCEALAIKYFIERVTGFWLTFIDTARSIKRKASKKKATKKTSRRSKK